MIKNNLDLLQVKKDEYERVLKETNAGIAINGITCGVFATAAITMMMEFASNISSLEDASKILLVIASFSTSILSTLKGYGTRRKIAETKVIKNEINNINEKIEKEKVLAR